MILAELSDYLRRKRACDPSFHVVCASGDAGQESTLEPGPAGFRRSQIVEGDGSFVTHATTDTGFTGFTHFLDGIQASRLVGYQGIVPIVYGFTAAVIRVRGVDRRLSVWREPAVQEAIYAPVDEIDADGFRQAGIPVQDTGSLIALADTPSSLYRQAAVNAIKQSRARAEQSLAQLWVAGSLTFATQHAGVVGVVKSHQTDYFPASEQERVLRLEPGHRTAVFQPGFGEAAGGDVYSWYLRLHPFERRELTFGLIRVEVDRRPEAVEEAELVSSWLLAERSPLSAPDPRWDRLFYPVHDCEAYLRSLAPSHAMMDAFLGV